MSDTVSVFPPPVDGDPVRLSLDCLREGFQIIAPDWTYVYVNPAAARHGRAAASDLIGRRMADVYPGIDRTPMFDVLQRCMEERRSEVIENQFTFPDGSRRWFELRIQPVPAGLCIYSSDIEDRKRRQLAGRPARRSFIGWLRSLFG